MTNFVVVCLLIMPWVLIPNTQISEQMRLPQSIFMDFMFLGIVAWSFYLGQRFVYRNKYLAFLVGYLFLHCFAVFFIPYGLDFKSSGRAINLWCLEPMLHLILGLWATFIILSNFDKEDFLRVAKALCISSVLVACFALLQFTGFDPMKSIAKYTLNGVTACLDNPNLVGNYLVLCLPLFLLFKNKLYWLGMILVALGILASRSHFAIFLMGFGLFTYFMITYRRNKIVVASLIILAILVGLYLIHIDFAKANLNFSGRLNVWKIGIDKVKESPLFGQGLGIFKAMGITTTPNGSFTMWTCIHNDWLERLIEIGLIGVFLILLVVINALKNFNWDENIPFVTTFLVFLFMCVGSFPFETATIALPGVISWWAVERL